MLLAFSLGILLQTASGPKGDDPHPGYYTLGDEPLTTEIIRAQDKCFAEAQARLRTKKINWKKHRALAQEIMIGCFWRERAERPTPQKSISPPHP